MQKIQSLHFKLITNDMSIGTVALSNNAFGRVDSASRIPKGLSLHLGRPVANTKAAYLESLGKVKEAETIRLNRAYITFVPEIVEQLANLTNVEGAKFKVANIYYNPSICTIPEFIKGINWLVQALRDERILRSFGRAGLFEVRKGFELVRITDDVVLDEAKND